MEEAGRSAAQGYRVNSLLSRLGPPHEQALLPTVRVLHPSDRPGQAVPDCTSTVPGCTSPVPDWISTARKRASRSG